MKTNVILTLAATTALMLNPTFGEAQKKEKTVTVGGAPMYPSKNIVENAVNSKDHTTLVAAVKAAGLVEVLQSEGPFTVLAPTNDAFAALPQEAVQNLLKPENKGQLTSILTYHVIPGRWNAADIKKAIKEGNGMYVAKSVQGEELTFWTEKSKIYVKDAKGNSANITISDVNQSNGVIHVVDQVLFNLESSETPKKEKTVMVGGAPMYPSKNIVENAVNSNDHTTLVAAVKAAGLVETLQGKGPFTVFAPTNSAFAKVPKAALESLLMPENKDQLTAILTYHVVAGNWSAAQIIQAIKDGNGQYVATTVQGGKLTFWMENDRLYVKDEQGNSAQVSIADVFQSNGVIHVIDAVLMP